MSVEQLQAIATWQGVQIQHQTQYLDERKNGKPQQHQLLLNAFQKLAQIQNKVTILNIFFQMVLSGILTFIRT